MEFWFIYNIASGQIMFKGNGGAGLAAQQIVPVGFVLIIVPQVIWDEGAATTNLPALQSAVWEQVKARRDAAIDGGATTPSGVVDSDALSRSNISGAVLAAVIAQAAGAPFSMDWTLKDNSVVTLDAADMIAVGLAVMSHVNSAHAVARVLRATIEAATDVGTLLQIDITAGWP